MVDLLCAVAAEGVPMHIEIVRASNVVIIAIDVHRQLIDLHCCRRSIFCRPGVK